MATNEYKFNEEDMKTFKEMIGDHKKLIIYVLGYGSEVGKLCKYQKNSKSSRNN